MPPAYILALLGSTALVVTVASAQRVEAQQALPEIVATSPSPILTRPETPQPPLGGDVPIGILPVVTNTFSPVTIVPRSEITRTQPTSLGDALSDKPGISGTSYAPGAANRPIIRGLDNYRVRIQENGIGVHDVSPLGEDHMVPISPLVQDRIEVIRGPATLRYGSQAIGGVVSAENNRIPTFIPQGGYEGQLLSGYSSVNNGTTNAVSVDAGAAKPGEIGGAVHADGFYTKSDDYGTPLGRQANSATRSEGGAVGYSFIGPNGFVGLSYEHFDALYHVPGGDTASRTRLDPRQDKVTAKGEYRFDGGPFEAVRFWFGGSNYRHDEIGIGENGVDGVQATFKNREYEGRVELQHVPILTDLGKITGALGFQADSTKLGTGGEAGGLLAPTDTRVVAGYLFEQLDPGQGTRFQLAGRIENDRVSGTATTYPSNYLPTFSPTGEIDAVGNAVLAADDPLSARRKRDFTPMSAAFGVLQDLPYGFVGSLTGSYVERAPAAPELYSRGSHDATETFEIGNPNLKLERARTVEVGIRKADGPLRLDATGYYTRYTGFIYKRLTGETCSDEFSSCGTGAGDLDQIVYSQQNATFYGAEVAAQLDIIPLNGGFAGLDAQYDFVHARFDDGTYVPRIPPHRVGAGIFYRANGWFARIGLLHAFDHIETAAYETYTKGYDDLRAEVSYTRPLDRAVYGFTELTVGVKGENLLNDSIRNSASFKKDEILLPGRNARAFVSLKF